MTSSVVLCLDYSGLYAAGTFSSSIGLLSEETDEMTTCLVRPYSGDIGWLLGPLYSPEAACWGFRPTTLRTDRSNFITSIRSLKWSQFQGSSCIMVSRSNINISLLLGVLELFSRSARATPLASVRFTALRGPRGVRFRRGVVLRA